MSDKEPTSQILEQTDCEVIKISIEKNSYCAVTKMGSVGTCGCPHKILELKLETAICEARCCEYCGGRLRRIIERRHEAVVCVYCILLQKDERVRYGEPSC